MEPGAAVEDSNGSNHRLTAATATTHNFRTIRTTLGYVRPEQRTVVQRRRPTENVAYVLRAQAPR